MPSYEIRGAYYRPPAIAILAVLGAGTPLTLRPDPCGEPTGTPHDDPHAISIHINPADIPKRTHQALTAGLANYGWLLEEILREPEIHLGYVPRDAAAKIRLDHEIKAKLHFTPTGKPSVTWEDNASP